MHSSNRSASLAHTLHTQTCIAWDVLLHNWGQGSIKFKAGGWITRRHAVLKLYFVLELHFTTEEELEATTSPNVWVFNSFKAGILHTKSWNYIFCMCTNLPVGLKWVGGKLWRSEVYCRSHGQVVIWSVLLLNSISCSSIVHGLASGRAGRG